MTPSTGLCMPHTQTRAHTHTIYHNPSTCIFTLRLRSIFVLGIGSLLPFLLQAFVIKQTLEKLYVSGYFGMHCQPNTDLKYLVRVRVFRWDSRRGSDLQRKAKATKTGIEGNVGGGCSVGGRQRAPKNDNKAIVKVCNIHNKVELEKYL